MLRIGTGSTATVVVLGGVHAREWAPPDALLSLAEGLVGAYARNGSMDHAEWIDDTARPPITYGAWSVSAADVKRIVDGVTLVLVPLVNPDGRDFTLAGADELHYMWRKNRRPPPAGHTGPWCAGVDLNRNFDIAWDFERYYNTAAAAEVQSSKDACDPQIYIGPSAASEPETRNVQSVVTQLRPSHFIDVHSYARAILFPWGMDDDQGREPTQNFHNPDWDRTGPHHGRDGVGGSYGEYLPSEMAAGHTAIARRMRDAIRDQAGASSHGAPPLDLHRQTGARPLPHDRHLRRLLRGGDDARQLAPGHLRLLSGMRDRPSPRRPDRQRGRLPPRLPHQVPQDRTGGSRRRTGTRARRARDSAARCRATGSRGELDDSTA